MLLTTNRPRRMKTNVTALPFRDEVFYLESALRHDKAGAARLDVDVVGPEALTAGLLADARVLYLSNVPRLEPAAVRAVLDFTNAGGGVLISVGDEVDVEWWNANLKL